MTTKFYLSDCYQTFLHGWCVTCNCTVSDPTFGRKNLPYHPYELELRESKSYIWHETFLEVKPIKTIEGLNTNRNCSENSTPTCSESSLEANQPFSPITGPKQAEFDEGLRLNRSSSRFLNLFSNGSDSNKVYPKIFYQSWVLDELGDSPTADLILIHGIAAYGGYLAKLIPSFTKAGFRCHLIDLPNHGRSDGIHVDLTNFQTLIAALHTTVLHVKNHSRRMKKELPLFVMGYSLGGLVAIHYCIQFPLLVDGLNLVSPCLKLNQNMLRSPTVINLARLVAFFLPRLPLPSNNRNKVEEGSKEEKGNDQGRKEPVNDPLTFQGSARIGTLVTILDQTYQVQKELVHLQTPFFVQQGAEDPVLDPNGAHLLYERSGSVDKLIRIYSGVEHDMFAVNVVLQEATDWLISQTKRLKSTTNLNN